MAFKLAKDLQIKKVGTVETGNDLYKTVVRLQLILFSKDIGAF
jgi:hypothetical protein